MTAQPELSTTERTARDPYYRALSLLDCYAAISEDGLAAISRGSNDALDDALGARAEIIGALDEPLARVRSAAAAGDDDALHAAAMLQARLHELASVESRLRVALGAELHSIDAELRAQGSAGRHVYDAPAPPPHLDRVG